MKTVFVLLISLSASILQAQTAIIAHKNHSGTSASFCIDPFGNFGAIEIDPNRIETTPPFYQQTFRSLNDSTIILERTDFNQRVIQVDTLANKHRYSDALFRYKYEDSTEKEELRKLYEEQLKYEQELLKQQKEQLEQQQQQLNESPKKKKKSYLLFLFGITGGGLLAFRVLNRVFTSTAAA